MTRPSIAHQRLHNQRIAPPGFEKPEEAVAWLGAVQSQDYLGAKWALGLRTRGAVDDDVERAFTNGSILRTHVMRPTWHFVSPADIRWLLALTAPRVNATVATYYRRQGLDEAVFARSAAALEGALQGGKQLTRQELRGALEQAGIAVESAARMGFLMARAELDGVVCSGARRGKQFTYALLEERVPQAATLTRDEALVELTRRYFTGHGPATVQDYVWWSGLTTADARLGLEMVGSVFEQETIDGRDYWFPPPAAVTGEAVGHAYLLPNFDEYGIGYTDRSAIFDASNADMLVFSHFLVIDGQMVGTWKRTLRRDRAIVEVAPFVPLREPERQAVAEAAERYGEFLGMPVSLA